jgi:hypothetical protein
MSLPGIHAVTRAQLQYCDMYIHCQTTPATHTANNTAAVSSLCQGSLRMRNDVTQQCLELT